MIDITKSKVAIQWKADRPLIACRIAPDASNIVASSEDNTLVRWKYPTGEKFSFGGHDSWVHALCYAPDSRTLVTGGCDGRLIWWNLETDVPQEIRRIDGHSGWIRAIDITPDGTQLVSVGNDRTIRLWNMQSGSKITEVPDAHERHIYSVQFHPTATKLITGDLLGKICVWNLPDVKRERTLEATPLYAENKGQNAEFGGVRSLAVNPSRNELIAGGTHKASNPFGAVHEPLMLRLNWEDGSLKKSHSCDGIPGGLLWRVQWLLDGTAVAVSGGSTGGILLFFNDAQEKEIHRFVLPSLARDMDLHPSNGIIATAHHDQHLRITNMNS